MGKPEIEASENGPYIVKGLKNFRNSRNESIEVKDTMALCRCGASGSKPFCDGSHRGNGFSGIKEEDRTPDKNVDYKGKEIGIRDNRGVCSHAGKCTENLPEVFRMKEEPWIHPDSAGAEKVERVVKMCPSGALSYIRNGKLFRDQERDPEIIITKDGPYKVTGSPGFKDQTGSVPESKEHFTLCRCGASKNKPFCDGSHWYVKFRDERN